MRRLLWAGPSGAQPEQLARGTVRSDAAAAARVLRAAGVTVTFAPVADVPERARSCARRPVVLTGSAGRERCRARGGERLAGGRRRGDGEALPRSRRRSREHRRRDRDHPTLARRARRRRPAAVQGRDRRRRSARHGRPRALSRARPLAHRVAVAADRRRACCATSSASKASSSPTRSRRRRRSRRGASRRCPSARSVPVPISCC